MHLLHAFVMVKFVGYHEAGEPFSPWLMQPCIRGGLGLTQWVQQTGTAAVAFQVELAPCSSVSAASSTTSIVKCCKPRLHSGLQPQFCHRAQEEDEQGMSQRGCLFGSGQIWCCCGKSQVALHHQPTQA
jgi:hypothetical protein